ncbi:MAG: nucleoside deaminase [Alphaproteobacteria bacterium]|nr:nucleoside deaminase [Alphaproteobacteria bacterium]
MTHEEYMKQALTQAELAAEQDEIPVGCLIVDPQTNEIIASTHNQSQHGGDVTDHAEILCIQQACQKLQQNRLWNLDMYVTLEPCTMCAAAISFARINHLYFGAYDEKGGAVTNGVRFYEQPTCHHRPQVTGGISEQECAEILRDFFRHKRKTKEE